MDDSLRRNGWVFAIGIAFAGCFSDPAASGDTDTDTDTDGSTSSGSTAPSTSTTAPTSASSSATLTTSDASTGEDPTTGDPTTGDDTTGGPPPAGVCVGVDIVGNTSDVSARGGANIDPTCDAAPAGCGGDIIGTWTVVSSCGFESIPNQFDESCKGATQALVAATTTGTRTFNEDLSFDWDVTTDLQWAVNLDATGCFGVDCVELGMNIDMDPDLSATCADAEDGTCDCDVMTSIVDQFSGTYAVMDNTITLTYGDEEEVLEYCTVGDRLDLWAAVFDFIFYEQECDSDAECAAALGDMSEFYVCFAEED